LIYVPTRRGDEIFYVSNFTIIGIITVVVTVIVVIYEFKAIVCLIIEIHAKMAEAKLAEVKEETKEAEVELESELEKPVDEEKEVA
jgi:energy-converting hydrogenase Eha subunit H